MFHYAPVSSFVRLFCIATTSNRIKDDDDDDDLNADEKFNARPNGSTPRCGKLTYASQISQANSVATVLVVSLETREKPTTATWSEKETRSKLARNFCAFARRDAFVLGFCICNISGQPTDWLAS